MSGHSKWSQIKRQKASVDIKRGQIFSKLARAIAISAREGGSGDPDVNYKLRVAIETAKSFNLPKENIQRAIEAGLGKGGGVRLEEVTYEGFAQLGVQVLVEAVTDNKNRTISEIKKVFEKNGGRMGSAGAVSWNFEKKGQIVVKLASISADEILTKAADAGADDIEVGESIVWVYCQPEKLAQVKKDLEAAGLAVESAELVMKPKNIVKITDAGLAKKVLNLVDSLDNLDDVQKVYANFDIPDELLVKSA